MNANRLLFAPTLLVAVFTTDAPANDASDAVLPIQRVVLYKHGIGYFERQGVVTGDAKVALRFKQAEMSDVLKTLTVLDRSGGAIEAIAYDSQKPPEMLLSEFAFDLRTDDVLQRVLEQLRGAAVTAEFAGSGVAKGSVLGLDQRVERVDGVEIKKPRLSVLTESGQVIGGDLADLKNLVFDDPALAGDIGRFLAVLRSTHRRDQRSLDLVCSGAGDRVVFASYAVEQPVWKATYRLVLTDAKSPHLQGWAVVDNTSDEDWTDVKLSLVAGLPVSFRQDLYTPEFRARPELSIQEVAVAGLWLGKEDATLATGGEAGFGAAKRGARSLESAEVSKLKELGYVADGKPSGGKSFDDAFRDVESQSVTREIGDLLEYTIDHAVTIPRNRSALLPIVSGAVEGSKVALYVERARTTNPFSAVRMKNTTELSLEGGPVTVLDGETYAGEAMLTSLKPNELRYVPFAVDLGVKATTKLDSATERVFHVAFLNGVMFTSRYRIATKTYTFDNKNPDARTVVIEHARQNGMELRAPQAKETELDRYRFELALAAGEKKSLAVVESTPIQEQFAVASVTPEQIALYVETGVLVDESRKFLEEVVAARAEIVALERQLAERDHEIKRIAGDEERLRRNREALGDSPDEKELVKLYVDRMRANEARVQELSRESTELRALRDAKQTALDAKIREFALEYKP
jgi:hypothetical protein